MREVFNIETGSTMDTAVISIPLEPVCNGHANSVRSFVMAGQRFYLKQFSNTQAYMREKTAWQILARPAEEAFFQDERSLALYPDYGYTAPPDQLDTCIRGLAIGLAQLHKQTLTTTPQVVDTQSQPGLVWQLLGGHDWHGTGLLAFLHGDACLTNSLFADDGTVTLIDFEESSWADPVIDLAIACIDCSLLCNANPAQHRHLIDLMTNTYSEQISSEPIRSFLSNSTAWKAVLEAALTILMDWAMNNNASQLLQAYGQASSSLQESVLTPC